MRLFEVEDRPLYYKKSPSAWRNKCMVLTCEQEGFLNRVIDFMWDVGHCVPDSAEGATAFRMNVLKFQKLAKELIETGHLIRGQGHIFNSRAMREIEEWNKARVARSRAAAEREFYKSKKRKSGAVEIDVIQQPKVGDENGFDPGRNEVNHESGTGRNWVGHGFDPGRNWVESKKPNENNVSGPDDCKNLYIERKEKEKEKEKKEHTSIQPRERAGEVPSEPSEILHPKVATAATVLAGWFGSEADPNHDKAYAVACRWAAAYGPDDTLDGVMDFDAKRRDRTELRQATEHLIGQFVRQAHNNRTGRSSQPEPVIKPAVRHIEIGPICDGMAINDRREIELSNDVRQQWIERFGGNEQLLDLSLVAAAARLRGNSPTPAEAQINAILAADCKDIIVRQQNTDRAVDRRGRGRGALDANDGKPAESKADRIRKMAEGIRNQEV